MRPGTSRPANSLAGYGRAASVAMGIGLIYVVVSLVLMMGFHLPPLPVLLLGGVVAWVAIMTTSISLGIRARRNQR